MSTPWGLPDAGTYVFSLFHVSVPVVAAPRAYSALHLAAVLGAAAAWTLLRLRPVRAVPGEGGESIGSIETWSSLPALVGVDSAGDEPVGADRPPPEDPTSSDDSLGDPLAGPGLGYGLAASQLHDTDLHRSLRWMWDATRMIQLRGFEPHGLDMHSHRRMWTLVTPVGESPPGVN